jgi:hypothetical protein
MLSLLNRLLEQQLGVTVGQEAEAVIHGEVVHATPLVIAYKSGNEE